MKPAGRTHMLVTAAVAAIAAVALGLLGACTSTGSSGGADGVPTAIPSGGYTVPGGGVIVGGSSALNGTNVPQNFPIPPGATARLGTTEGSRSSITLSGISSARAGDFYSGALPKAGYTITHKSKAPGGLASAMSFTGHGVKGDLGSIGAGSAQLITIVFVKQ
jgi:hypothetical protein